MEGDSYCVEVTSYDFLFIYLWRWLCKVHPVPNDILDGLRFYKFMIAVINRKQGRDFNTWQWHDDEEAKSWHLSRREKIKDQELQKNLAKFNIRLYNTL